MASTVNWTEALAPGKPPLPPDVVLVPELLKKIGIGPSKLDEIHANLRRNGRETVGNLLAIETKAETIEIVGDKVSGQTIWAFIEKQKLADGRPSSAQGLSPPLQTHPNLRDISAFFREQLIAENSEDADSLSKRLRRTPSSREDFVLKLAEDLSRDPYNCDEFVVRKEIQDVVDQILDFFEDTRTKKQARLLIGNKGCGKTTVGKIIVVRHRAVRSPRSVPRSPSPVSLGLNSGLFLALLLPFFLLYRAARFRPLGYHPADSVVLSAEFLIMSQPSILPPVVTSPRRWGSTLGG
jgi:hypothetical protein